MYVINLMQRKPVKRSTQRLCTWLSTWCYGSWHAYKKKKYLMEWEEGFQARGQSSGMTSPHQQRIHLCSQLTTIPHRARSSLLLVLSTRISVHDNDIPPTTYTSISCYICITVTPRWVVISVSLSQQRYHCYTSMSCYICIIVTTVVSLLHSKVSKVNVDLYSA